MVKSKQVLRRSIPSAATCSRKSTLVALAFAACRRLEARMEGRLRISLLAAVQLPTRWRRIDVSGNRRRHPADTEAEKDQQDGLRALAAPDRQCEYQNNPPDDGEASAVDPIVSEAKHLIPPVPFEGHHL